MTKPILPGATLGVLGGGQLGRMFAIAARRLGYRVIVFCPEEDTPTGQVCDASVVAADEDLEAVARFAQQVAVVTFEFENVPAITAEAAARYAPVRPAGTVLHTTQHRIREKSFLRDAGLPVTPFVAVASEQELIAGLDTLGTPAVLKTAAWGYDGKGQTIIRRAEDALTVWRGLNARESILEAFVDFECELSVVAVRGLDGSFTWYGPIRNEHHYHILDSSTCPADLPESVRQEAVQIAQAVLEGLKVVGVLCVEFFLNKSGKLLINELAPRPHNSGHLTIDAHVCSQFEQQVRAICGLPLGSTRQIQPAAMVNLLGDLWTSGEPRWSAALSDPEARLHLYGKRQARTGRKMGHLTVLSDSVQNALVRAMNARGRLTP